jgi:hypothetical protein
MRVLCCALAALFAYTAITAHRAHHVDYRQPAHHTTSKD